MSIQSLKCLLGAMVILFLAIFDSIQRLEDLFTTSLLIAVLVLVATAALRK